MATNYTEQFQLNLWESGDAFRREEFNQDNQKLENALKSHAAALEVHNGQITALEQVQTAQSQTLNALSSQKASVYVGTYEGNNASERTITLGYTPKAVVLWTSTGKQSDAYGGMAYTNMPCTVDGSFASITIVDNGFQVRYNSCYHCYTNLQGTRYVYLAFV